jgi:hypothetical protein
MDFLEIQNSETYSKSIYMEWKFTTVKSVKELLIPWSKVLLDKLIVTQLVKKLPTFYVTRKIITVLERARHWSLS